MPKRTVYRALPENLRQLFELDSSSRNLIENIIFASISFLYFRIILISNLTNFLVPNDIILVHLTNEIRVSFIIKTLTFLARICLYRARKAPLCSVIRLKKCHSVFSFCSFII